MQNVFELFAKNAITIVYTSTNRIPLMTQKCLVSPLMAIYILYIFRFKKQYNDVIEWMWRFFSIIL